MDLELHYESAEVELSKEAEGACWCSSSVGALV